jgi:hypothetical protein
MTALAEQLTALGYYNTTAIADLAITAGQVYRDSNGYVRCAGSNNQVQADVASTGQVAGLTLLPAYAAAVARGTSTNKW